MGRGALCISFVRTVIWLKKAPSYWPNHFQRPHLPTPSHWGLCFNTWIWGMKAFCPQHHSTLQSPLCSLHCPMALSSYPDLILEASDVDSNQQCLRCCGCDKQIHTHCRIPVEKRDGMATFWVRELPNPCLTGFYCFSGSIISRKVFIHHCQAVMIKQ